MPLDLKEEAANAYREAGGRWDTASWHARHRVCYEFVSARMASRPPEFAFPVVFRPEREREEEPEPDVVFREPERDGARDAAREELFLVPAEPREDPSPSAAALGDAWVFPYDPRAAAAAPEAAPARGSGGPGDGPPSPPSPSADAPGICSICLEAGGQRTHLPCGHGFHISCIGSWFAVQRTCPLCRNAADAINRISIVPNGMYPDR